MRKKIDCLHFLLKEKAITIQNKKEFVEASSSGIEYEFEIHNVDLDHESRVPTESK